MPATASQAPPPGCPSAPATAPVKAGPSRGQLVILGLLSAFGPLSLDMYLPGLPALTHSLHASAAAGQLTMTACMLGLGLGQLTAGPVSDARGRRGPLVAGLVCYIAASVACAAAPSVGLLMAARFVQGMAGGVGIVVARAIVRDLAEGVAAARVFSLLMAITGVAPVFAPLLGGQVLAVTSWRGVFVVLAGIGCPLLLGTLWLLSETLPEAARHAGGLRVALHNFRRLVGDRRFSPYAGAFALSFGSMFAYISGSSFVLEDIYGISPQLFSVVFAVNSAALIAASQVGGRLVARFGAPLLLRCGLVGVAVTSLAIFVLTMAGVGLAGLLPCFFLLMGANGLVLPNATAAAMADQEGALGAASALLGLEQFGCGAIVAPLVGVAGSHTAVPMAIVIVTAGSMALFVDLTLAPRPPRLHRAPGR